MNLVKINEDVNYVLRSLESIYVSRLNRSNTVIRINDSFFLICRSYASMAPAMLDRYEYCLNNIIPEVIYDGDFQEFGLDQG